MDYEKKYKDLYLRLQKVFNTTKSQEVIDMLFDNFREELYESEDERIRKEIIDFLRYGIWRSSVIDKIKQTKKEAKWIAYLEKQKEQKDSTPDDIAAAYQMGLAKGRNEQKPVEWSEDFEDNIRNLLHDKLTGHSKDGSMSWATLIDDKTLKDIVSGIWFYVGKEALKYPNKEIHVPEWSEEDERMRQTAIEACKTVAEDYENSNARFYKCKDWLEYRLKSLRPLPHWKPSEEQMKDKGI